MVDSPTAVGRLKPGFHPGSSHSKSPHMAAELADRDGARRTAYRAERLAAAARVTAATAATVQSGPRTERLAVAARVTAATAAAGGQAGR